MVNNKIPASLLESMKPGEPLPYSDNPANVKIIISIREDCVGQLDEISRGIPVILHHRFRLLPLSREQAKQAIIEPPQVQDDVIDTVSFTFAPEAVETMLDFMCKRRERDIIKMTDEVESFQLQLLCRNIEDMVRDRTEKEPGDIIVKKKDLGGEAGMQRVLQRFYDDQVEQLGSEVEKEKVRKLCEEGLISITDRRLSLEEVEIKIRFNVSKDLLKELVNSRLLRAESRVGIVYYEKKKVNNALIYHQLGKAFFAVGKTEEAIKNFEESILSGPNLSMPYEGLREVYSSKKEFKKAIEYYTKALNIDEKKPDIYREGIGNFLYKSRCSGQSHRGLQKSDKG